MMSSPEFEIHFAAEVNGLPDKLKSDLYKIGFRDDGLLNQAAIFDDLTGRYYQSCPLIDIHITWDTYDREEYLQKKEAFKQLLEKHAGSCCGYSHAEYVKPEWDIDIELQEFKEDVKVPFQHFRPELPRKFKKWDIHISAHKDTLDPKLEEVLFAELGLYYIDVKKKNGRVHRVFTIQGSNSVKIGLEIFESLKSYLEDAGGMAGAIKFEQTIFGEVYGTPRIVPPTIGNG